MKVTELNYKPGQHLACTVEKLPLNEGASDTIARLMRLDPANKKALRTAQRMRKQREVIYNRGNRDWHKREKTAKVVHVGRVQLGVAFGAHGLGGIRHPHDADIGKLRGLQARWEQWGGHLVPSAPPVPAPHAEHVVAQRKNRRLVAGLSVLQTYVAITWPRCSGTA